MLTLIFTIHRCYTNALEKRRDKNISKEKYKMLHKHAVPSKPFPTFSLFGQMWSCRFEFGWAQVAPQPLFLYPPGLNLVGPKLHLNHSSRTHQALCVPCLCFGNHCRCMYLGALKGLQQLVYDWPQIVPHAIPITAPSPNLTLPQFNWENLHASSRAIKLQMNCTCTEVEPTNKYHPNHVVHRRWNLNGSDQRLHHLDRFGKFSHACSGSTYSGSSLQISHKAPHGQHQSIGSWCRKISSLYQLHQGCLFG